jgi:uncharacterized protein (PEP-CTERM system associated)
MTITTAKRRAAAPRLAPLAAAVCAILAAPHARSDWSVRPALELRETYTDNVALRADDPQAQWVTEVNPGLEIAHRGRRLTVSSRARLNYFVYGDERVSGTNRFYKQFDGAANAELLEDRLFLEATGSIGPRNISPFGTQAAGNRFSSANSAEVTSYSLSPMYTQRFGSAARLLARYTRDSVDGGESGFGSSDGNIYLLDLSSGPAYRTLSWGVRATRQEIERFRGGRPAGASGAQKSRSDTALATLGYALSGSFQLTASAGYDGYDFGALGGKTEGASWSTGFAWQPSSRTSLQASVGKRHIGSSNSLQALHRSRRSTWRIGYNEAVNTTRSNFTLPSTFDTASLIDRLLRPSFPDPVERQAAVEDYIREAGLPPALVENISFLSNRYYLQKQLTASAGWKLARTSATLSLYRTRSDALTDSQSDSVILGQATSSLNNKTRQVGGSFTLNYKISPRSNLRLLQTVSENTSLSNARRQTTHRATRLGVTRALTRDLKGSLELRRISGTSVSSSYAPYREKAIAATLSYQR